jgi:hypothetical protein
MIPCLLCGAEDHEACGCWETVEIYEADEVLIAEIEKQLSTVH